MRPAHALYLLSLSTCSRFGCCLSLLQTGPVASSMCFVCVCGGGGGSLMQRSGESFVAACLRLVCAVPEYLF
jgi:hypothetical protein